MSPIETDGIERSLGRLRPRAAPVSLKSEILATALESRKAIGMTPRMWLVTAVCSALLIITFWGDAVVSRSQAEWFLSILGKPAVLQEAEGETLSLPAEMDEVFSAFEAPRFALNLVLRRERGTEGEGNLFDALNGLKGRSIDEEMEENNN